MTKTQHPLWQRTRVSPDETHHCIDGCPLYRRRFLRVLAFHAPGLAAVHSKRGAFHIDVCGAAAYPHCFADAVGFYEKRAAVRGDDGWFHILPDGAPAYSAVYQWCGNFQSGRAVVRSPSGYCHILPDGSALYPDSFLYAGDFRERRAVVRLSDGLCAHIGEDGNFAHTSRYDDLDVYHKGYARARDKNGWMHIGRDGKPIYKKRFAQLEPFYNGRALAQTFDGDIVTIDSSGKNTDAILSGALPSGFGTNAAAQALQANVFGELSADMVGYWKTYALAVAAKLGLAAQLPATAEAVAAALKLPAENARTLLYAMAQIGAVKKTGRRWSLTAKGKLLHPDHPQSLADAALVWAAQAEEGSEIWLSGMCGKKSPDIFTRFAKKKRENALTHSMLAAYARHDYAELPAVLPAADITTLVDAGGGNGTTAKLLAAVHKNLTITVLERKEVKSFFQKNVGKHSGITFCAGDLFRPWPVTADAVLLARILHDWNDAQVLTILQNAHAALPHKGRLFIAERISMAPADNGLCSFHLLTVGGGSERTLAEYKNLMVAAGFRFVGRQLLKNHVYLLIGESK